METPSRERNALSGPILFRAAIVALIMKPLVNALALPIVITLLFAACNAPTGAVPNVDGETIDTTTGTSDSGSNDSDDSIADDIIPTVKPTPNPDLGKYRPFPDDHEINRDVSGDTVDPNSAAYIASMSSGSRQFLHPDFGTVWEGRNIGFSYVVVPGTQPRVPMSFLYSSESEPGPYPIPANAPIEGGQNATGDRHVLVIDRDNQKLYELFMAYPNSDGSWRADSGAVWDLKSGADRPSGWTSADAAGMPIYPTLVRYDEVMVEKEIRHALRFTTSKTQAAHVYPARHHASTSTDPNRPPMGARVRLKASYDISWASPPAQVILRAMKKYGMILADNGMDWMVSGAHDMRWDDSKLGDLKKVPGSAFEVVRMATIVR